MAITIDTKIETPKIEAPKVETPKTETPQLIKAEGKEGVKGVDAKTLKAEGRLAQTEAGKGKALTTEEKAEISKAKEQKETEQAKKTKEKQDKMDTKQAVIMGALGALLGVGAVPALIAMAMKDKNQGGDKKDQGVKPQQGQGAEGAQANTTPTTTKS